MKLSILSIHDKLVGYGKAFCDVNNDVAVRSFSATMQHMSENPQDYNSSPFDLSLFHVGYFDTSTGLIESFKSPEFITSGVLILNTIDDLNEVIDDGKEV